MDTDNRDRIEQMKKTYDQIQAPFAAYERMMAGVAQAEREKRRKTMIRFSRNTGIGVAAAMAAITIMVNVSPTVAHAMEDIPVIGAIARVVTFRTYEDQADGYEAKIEVPEVSLDGRTSLDVNRSIEEYADQLIRQYEEELTNGQGEGHYALDSTYQVVTDDDKYLSIRIDTTEVMASGAQYVKIFTVDKATGETVTLKELFKEQADFAEKISAEIRRQMGEQMAADDSKIYFYDPSGNEVEEGFSRISGEESFYFNNEGELVIVFDEYAVAPGYMGAVEFTIPENVTGIKG